MQYKIPLVVDGLDLDDASVVSAIATDRDLSELMWTRVSGRTLATLFVDEHPVIRASEAALAVRAAFPWSCVLRVDRDIVGTAEIADRAGVTGEAVRLWVAGRRGPGHFPAPVGATGGGGKGASKLWFWGDVNAWLATSYELGDGYRYLSERQHAMLTERLTSMGQNRTVVALKTPVQPTFTQAPSDLMNVILTSEKPWTPVPVSKSARPVDANV